MAKLIQAYAAYCPKIELGKPAKSKRFLEAITQRTTLSSGVVKNVQESEVETLIAFLKEGRAVHTGIAVFTPTIDMEGNLNVSVRVDKRIVTALNIEKEFTGEVLNSANIGKTAQEITDLWNKEHPENPIPVQVAPFGTQ